MSINLSVVCVDGVRDVHQIHEQHIKYLPDHGFQFGKVNSVDEYNRLLTSRFFWESIKFENVLIIQHDSGILRSGIEEFYEFDFIGAPIKHIPFPAMNGGFSLRKKEAMLKVIDSFPYAGGNEDMYFCNSLKELGGNLPDQETAQKFSCETIFNYGSMGYHAIDKWLTNEECNLILNQYTNEVSKS